MTNEKEDVVEWCMGLYLKYVAASSVLVGIFSVLSSVWATVSAGDLLAPIAAAVIVVMMPSTEKDGNGKSVSVFVIFTATVLVRNFTSGPSVPGANCSAEQNSSTLAGQGAHNSSEESAFRETVLNKLANLSSALVEGVASNSAKESAFHDTVLAKLANVSAVHVTNSSGEESAFHDAVLAQLANLRPLCDPKPATLRSSQICV